MNFLLRAGLGVLALYLIVLGALFVFQRRLVFRPNTSIPDIAALAVAQAHAVRIPTPDGLELLAWWRPADPGRPTLLYLHGNGGNLSDRVPRFRRFASEGWGLLFLEYRGFGGNDGSPSESGFNTDAAAASAWLDQAGVRPEQLVIYGESIGTGVATTLAASRTIAALLLESPYTSIRGIAESQYPWAPVRWLIRDPFELLARLPSVHAPILVMQGGMDTIVPPAMGQAVFAAAADPKRLWSAPAGGHNNLMEFGSNEVAIAFVDEFVTRRQAAKPGIGRQP